ncbi:DUF817 domain-containing protein [Campylobacter sp. JMF_04 NA10]|uniref:DUF817 domain-containing protein n=1 Tax=Campylobacter sp. JMF_04 NA10 TaxID=2983824 RepID=UPI0022E9FEE8|nr:DUF817 domain-containing protein [Campylobacter sp. JMF_04 NA10]MDA3076064.1 DUF817 domain-containing protein [Campylobacter sp. JMF_04 NA10]
MKFFIAEFWAFGLKQIRACIFAGSFFVLLFASKHLNLGFIARYDFLLISALVLQILLVAFKFESLRELCAICLFHAIGLALEIFKTHPAIGSWSYPEAGIFKIYGVPLYSGFMYAAVGSYMIQAWRILHLRLAHMPRSYASFALCALIYANFFTHHFIGYDFRYVLLIAVCALYFRAKVYFRPRQREYQMPLLLAFCLIGFFIWVAENIATFFGAWVYPNQAKSWQIVGFGKISSWILLCIISFIIVAILKRIEGKILSNS